MFLKNIENFMKTLEMLNFYIKILEVTMKSKLKQEPELY
jgi:hypothetical protein